MLEFLEKKGHEGPKLNIFTFFLILEPKSLLPAAEMSSCIARRIKINAQNILTFTYEGYWKNFFF
jgi:hypothetical protein